MLQLTVVGPGCSNCTKLAENTREAAEALGLEFTLEKVTDMTQMIELGVMTPPALLVDGKIKLLGKAASVGQLKEILVAP